MHKFILVYFIILSSFGSFNSSFADCRDSYKDKIKQLDGRTNPPMATMAINGVASVAVPAIIAASGGAVTIAGSVALPAAALGAGAYYGVLIARKRSFQKSLKLINDAVKGDGAQLDHFFEKVSDGTASQKLNIISIILKANAENIFCRENELNGKIKPFDFHQIKNYVELQMMQD